MTSSSGHLTKLVALAHETSSDKRRELLRDITDLFIESPAARDGASGEHVDQILTTVAADVAESVRAELAERFADAGHAPSGLVRRLAMDAIDVARPLLERGGVLTEDDLLHVAQAKGEAHLAAIAGRTDLPENVADVVAERGESEALVALASNVDARLSRHAMETLVDKSGDNGALHAPLVRRDELPPDLLNEMFLVVEHKLRDEIAERMDGFSEAELKSAFEAARKRLRRNSKTLPRDYDDAVKFIQVKKLRKQLDPALLAVFLREKEPTRFVVGFADLTGLDFHAARRVADNPDIDPMAIACRSVDMPRDDFLALAVLRSTSAERTQNDLESLGEIYDAVPVEAAHRVMRFWKVRKDAQAA